MPIYILDGSKYLNSVRRLNDRRLQVPDFGGGGGGFRDLLTAPCGSTFYTFIEGDATRTGPLRGTCQTSAEESRGKFPSLASGGLPKSRLPRLRNGSREENYRDRRSEVR